MYNQISSSIRLLSKSLFLISNCWNGSELEPQVWFTRLYGPFQKASFLVKWQ